jgi:hypothetical protein
MEFFPQGEAEGVIQEGKGVGPGGGGDQPIAELADQLQIPDGQQATEGAEDAVPAARGPFHLQGQPRGEGDNRLRQVTKSKRVPKVNAFPPEAGEDVDLKEEGGK